MCGKCGCGEEDHVRVVNMQTGKSRLLGDHVPDADHDHAHLHAADHRHGHDHHTHGHDDDQTHDHIHAADGSIITLEADILAKNDRLAARNRGWFEGREIFAINLVSSPGAGKTTLLERTIRELKGKTPIYVIEGDQATAHDGERIRAAGAPAVQINTGAGCHLEADMVARGLEELKPAFGSVVLIENVGNLVCPAMFDLGERAKVVILSVAEGEDKPLKYPHMFKAATLMLINKTDLLPYVEFDVDAAVRFAREVNPDIEIIQLSVRNGEGVDAWCNWLLKHCAAAAA